MPISNGNEENGQSGVKAVEFQPFDISSRVRDQKEHMNMWLLENIEGITFSVLDTYVSVLYKDGIGSIARLARKIERDRNYLYSLSVFDDMDIEDITRKLGVSVVQSSSSSSAKETASKEMIRPSSEMTVSSSGNTANADRVIARKRDHDDIFSTTTAESGHKPSTSSSAEAAKGERESGVSASTSKALSGILFLAMRSSLVGTHSISSSSPCSKEEQSANKKPRILNVDALLRDADVLHVRSKDLFDISCQKKSSLSNEGDETAQRRPRCVRPVPVPKASSSIVDMTSARLKSKRKSSADEIKKDSRQRMETTTTSSSRGSEKQMVKRGKGCPVRQKYTLDQSESENILIGDNIKGKAKATDKSAGNAATRITSGSNLRDVERDDFSFFDHAVFTIAPRDGGGGNNGSDGNGHSNNWENYQSAFLSQSIHPFRTSAIAAAGGFKAPATSRFSLIAACLQKDESALKKELYLLSSCSQDPLDILSQLELSDPDLDDQTALQVAIDTKHAGIVALLLQAGANMNISDRYGVTALIQASLKGAAEIMKLLISHGALLNTRDLTKGRSALSCACKCGYSLCVRVLLNAGANTEIRDNDGETPLISAARWGHLDCVKLLIRAGADSDAVDRHGHTAYFLATREERLACARFLETSGKSLSKVEKSSKGCKHAVVKFNIATDEIVAFYRNINEAHHETGYSYKRMRDSVLSSAHGAQLGDAGYRFVTPDDILPPAVVTASKQLRQRDKQPGWPRQQPSVQPSVVSSSPMPPPPMGLLPGVRGSSEQVLLRHKESGTVAVAGARGSPEQVLLRHKESGTVAVVDVLGDDPIIRDIIWRPPLSSPHLSSTEDESGALRKKSREDAAEGVNGVGACSSLVIANSEGNASETLDRGNPSSEFGSSSVEHTIGADSQCPINGISRVAKNIEIFRTENVDEIFPCHSIIAITIA